MSTADAGPAEGRKPDARDRDLLNALQAGIPLERSPWARVGVGLDMSEEEVLQRVGSLKEGGIIRQVSAIFDTRALGFESSLVAAAYPDDRLFEAASIIGGHPGVSHNYRRTHRFNLWFTLATDPDSELGLDRTLDMLAEASGADAMRHLPTLELYKINVQLDMTGEKDATRKQTPAPPPRRGDGNLPSDEDREVIQILQRDLPLDARPFDTWAVEADRDPDELLAAAALLRERTLMRRFAAVLNHRKAGFGANGMAVWRIPEEELATIGPKMAAFSAVSHCYRRPTYDDWPYSIFTMVHARSMASCEETIVAIAEEVGYDDPGDRAVLYSTHEFKKIRLQYYTPDYAEWERAAVAGEDLPRW